MSHPAWPWHWQRFEATYRCRFVLGDGRVVEIIIDVETAAAVRFNRVEIRTVAEEPVVWLNTGRTVPDASDGEVSDGEEKVPTTQPDVAPAEPAAGASAGPAEETVPADIAGMARNVRRRTG